MQPSFGKHYFIKKMVYCFLFCFILKYTIQILLNPNSTWSKSCSIQILQITNFAWSKLCIIQILHDPNFARSRDSYNPNFAWSKLWMIQMLLSQFLFLFFTPHFLVCCFFTHSVDFFILVRHVSVVLQYETSWFRLSEKAAGASN